MTEPNPSPAPTKKPRKPRKKKRNQPRQAGTVRAVFARIRGLPWYRTLMSVLIGLAIGSVLADMAVGAVRGVLSIAGAIRLPQIVASATTAPSASESWESVARWVESGQITETEELVKVCRQLQKAGYLTDLSRIDVYVKAPKHIDESNRAAIAAVLRGS